MRFARGNITQEMKIVGKTDKTGTVVTFQPDPEMFDTLEYSYDTLHTRMREEALDVYKRQLGDIISRKIQE